MLVARSSGRTGRRVRTRANAIHVVPERGWCAAVAPDTDVEGSYSKLQIQLPGAVAIGGRARGKAPHAPVYHRPSPGRGRRLGYRRIILSEHMPAKTHRPH